MGIGVALVLAAAFGAGDQYLGSLPAAIPWGAEVSLLSAPWLLLGFVAGATQREPRRAMLLGLGCTLAALLGYFLLTDSPLENAHYSLENARGFLISDPSVAIGGLFMGPLFGWFGQQWRARRALFGALTVAGALCLEPLARLASHAPISIGGFWFGGVYPIGVRGVWLGEITAGLMIAVYATLIRVRVARSET